MVFGWLIGAASAVPAEPPLRDGAGVVRPLPRPAIILFWAAWCAPCRAEVAQIGALSKAAAPIPVIIVATDASRSTRTLLGGLDPARVRFPANGGDVMALMPGGSAGLPAAMAFDAQGRPCATIQGAVDVALLREWRTLCTGPGAGNR